MQNLSLLLVDDDTDFSELLSIRLESLGYKLFVAHRATLALTLLQQHSIDVVITDLKMDHMDGLELFHEIKKRYSALPVIIMTAHGSIPDAIQATESGVAGFLTKPINIDKLQAILLSLTQNKRVTKQLEGQFHGLFYESQAMHALVYKLQAIAQSTANILIQGESGTGKEVTANAIHSASNAHKGPFIAINCGAVPANLLESELFGHKKGAFTGAAKDKIGLIELANGGTLFLDEVTDMPLDLQVKMLRFLQERKIRPVGAYQEVAVDVRILSASHKDLWQAVQDGTFREDLYYRLNVISITLPSLRERPEDITFLANHFLKKHAGKTLSQDALSLIVNYDWPGNVRQLQNVIEHAAILTPAKLIVATTVSEALPKQSIAQIKGLNEAKLQFEYEYLLKVLSLADNNVAKAAVLAQRNRSDFYKLLKKHNIALIESS